MVEQNTWRGYDLTKRKAKIRNAFEIGEVKSAEDIPVVVNTPGYFGFGSKLIPDNYYESPESMVSYQESAYEEHMKKVHDDMVPYLMPWFGTGVLANAFGCEVRMPEHTGEDPAIISYCVNDLSDIAKLHLPDPYKNGLMPRVLDFIDYAKENSDLPIGLTDMNGILSTICQMCGYENLFIWMYEEPDAIHGLFDIVTQAFIDWTKAQKKHIGEPLNCSNGLQGIWSPKGGVWMSDDDLMILSPELYKEFVVPYASRVYKEFGGGSLHFCGNGYHQIENILNVEHLTVVNNSPMSNFDQFASFANILSGKFAIQIQDAAPINVEKYYSQLFEGINDLRGIMLATFVIDTLGLDNGSNRKVDWDTFEVANRIVSSVRNCAEKKLKGSS